MSADVKEILTVRREPGDDALHIEAANYANARRLETAQYRQRMGSPPLHEDIAGWTWVAHYEGFKAGMKAKKK